MGIYKVIIDYPYSEAENDSLFLNALDAVINNDYTEFFAATDAVLSPYDDIVQYDDTGKLSIVDTSTISDTTLVELEMDIANINNIQDVTVPMLESIIPNSIKYLAQVKKFYTVTNVEDYYGKVMLTLEHF